MAESDLHARVLAAVQAAGFPATWGDGHHPTKSPYRIYLLRRGSNGLRVSIAFVSFEHLTGVNAVVSLAAGSQHADNTLDVRDELLAWAAPAVMAAMSVAEPELAEQRRHECDRSSEA